LRTRTFPDKAVDLLEQCVATAVVEKASDVDLSRAQAVAQELVGMPIDLDTRLDALEKKISESGLLTADDTSALLDRLNVTMRGLDLQPLRPASVALLTGQAAANTDVVAEALAETLFGGGERVVDIDFSQFDGHEDVNTLVGPPPGYIGFEGRRPLHALAQMPRAVLLCRNVHGCHPEVREVLGEALARGVVAERSGKRIYLSDALVLLTAATGVQASQAVGFARGSEEGSAASDQLRAAQAELGAGFAEQIDLVFSERNWVEQTLLVRLADQYRTHGVSLEWDKSLIAWIVKEQASHPTRAGLTRMVEERLGEALIPHLPEAGAGEIRARVSAKRGAVKVKLEPSSSEGGSG
jgi:ATP-dependent Clp protease ATP-binding subunit ClpA